MQTIIDLLNKIKWDKKENPEDFSVFYLDRISRKLVKVPFTAVKRIEGSFMIIEKDKEEVEIPVHRIREIRKKENVILKR